MSEYNIREAKKLCGDSTNLFFNSFVLNTPTYFDRVICVPFEKKDDRVILQTDYENAISFSDLIDVNEFAELILEFFKEQKILLFMDCSEILFSRPGEPLLHGKLKQDANDIFIVNHAKIKNRWILFTDYDLSKNVCSWCGITGSHKIICRLCGVAKYCSVECLSTHKITHSNICPSIKNALNTLPSDGKILITRFYYKNNFVSITKIDSDSKLSDIAHMMVESLKDLDNDLEDIKFSYINENNDLQLIKEDSELITRPHMSSLYINHYKSKGMWYVGVQYSDHSEKICRWCLKPDSKLKCVKCHAPYCSKECQCIHWSQHKTKCIDQRAEGTL
jgi:hypothetical protein